MNNRLVKKTTAVQLLSRRQVLTFLGTGTAAVFLGCRRVKRSGNPTTSLASLATADAAVIPSCVVRPEQTEGPYFIDEKLNRSDIRSDPSDGSVKPGVPLRLAFHVSRVSDSSCSPLSGAVVDIWQCDARRRLFGCARHECRIRYPREKVSARLSNDGRERESPNFSRSIPAGTRAEPFTSTLRFEMIPRPGALKNSIRSFTLMNPPRIKFTSWPRTTARDGAARPMIQTSSSAAAESN